jgi:hypothetical protein
MSNTDGYSARNLIRNSHQEGVDYFGDLFLNDEKVGTIVYYGSHGEGPYIQTNEASRKAFEAVAGQGMMQERFIHLLFNNADKKDGLYERHENFFCN